MRMGTEPPTVAQVGIDAGVQACNMLEPQFMSAFTEAEAHKRLQEAVN